jgi:hypothetical protein
MTSEYQLGSFSPEDMEREVVWKIIFSQTFFLIIPFMVKKKNLYSGIILNTGKYYNHNFIESAYKTPGVSFINDALIMSYFEHRGNITNICVLTK